LFESSASLNVAINSVLQQHEMQDKIKQTGSTPEIGSPEDLGTVLLNSYNLWRGVVQRIGLATQ
jgi:tripartite-type tricarboxylate transporter receptor subunit TctC